MRPFGAIVLAASLLATPALAQGVPADSPRAMLSPLNEATLSGELAARIKALPFKEGQRFRKGQVLVEFDCAAFVAAQAEARASLKAAEKSLANVRDLARLQSAGQLEVQLAEAEVDKQRARLDAAGVQVSRCAIHAPFDGRVVERKAKEHESPPPGQPLLAIIDDSKLEVRLNVPSDWARWLKDGTPFKLKVDETGRTYDGKIVRIVPRIDPVSRLIAVYGALDNEGREMIAGMSGTAFFSPPAQ